MIAPRYAPRQQRLDGSVTESTILAIVLRIGIAILVSATVQQPTGIWADEMGDAPVCVACGEQVTLWQWGPPNQEASWNYVIAHGQGGTRAGDRFQHLANAIRRECPDSSVLLIDWSVPATKTRYGIPWPWDVARAIDPVANECALHLRALKIAPQRTTFIGESFGCFVVNRIASATQGSARILAFNPANECGGYALPDLRKSVAKAWSFHTFSPFDTTHAIAHADVFLETPSAANSLIQHTFGISWLITTLKRGDRTWLEMSRSLPQRQSKVFSIKATLTGEAVEVIISRDRESRPLTDNDELPVSTKLGELAGATP